MKKVSLFLLLGLLVFVACSSPSEKVNSPAEEQGSMEVQIPEKKDPSRETKKFSSPEEIAGQLALEHAGEGRITFMRTKEYQSKPVMEVHIQKEQELLVYVVDPETKTIESLVVNEQEDPGITIEEGHFLVREFSGGKTELREIQVEEDALFYTLKQGKGGKVFRVDKLTKKVEEVKEIEEIFALKGEVYIDLFQAIQKIEVFYGDIDLQYAGYVPQSDERSAIELRVFFKENEPEVLRTMRLDTYTGVVYEQDF